MPDNRRTEARATFADRPPDGTEGGLRKFSGCTGLAKELFLVVACLAAKISDSFEPTASYAKSRNPTTSTTLMNLQAARRIGDGTADLIEDLGQRGRVIDGGERHQVVVVGALVPADHRARMRWTMVERLDLSAFCSEDLSQAIRFSGRSGPCGSPASRQ
jgi:hypothetical protein